MPPALVASRWGSLMMAAAVIALAAGPTNWPLGGGSLVRADEGDNKSDDSQFADNKPKTNPATQVEPNKTLEVSPESEPLYMQHMNIVLVTLHLSVFVTGLVGNALVCLSVYRNKSLQTITNYYIVNLAVADFLVILICLPPTVYWDLTLFWSFGLVLCKLVLYLQSISVSVSVLTLTCISIDRWYAICRPLNFSSSKSRAKSTIGLIWLVSALIASPDVIFLTLKPIGEENNYVYMDCTYSWPETSTKIYQLCIVTLLFVLPFVLMTISYSEIVNVLWRNETMAETMQNSMIQPESETVAAAAAESCEPKQAPDSKNGQPVRAVGSSIISIMSDLRRKASAKANAVKYYNRHHRKAENHLESGGDRKCDGNCGMQDNEQKPAAVESSSRRSRPGERGLEAARRTPPPPPPPPRPMTTGRLKITGVIIKRPIRQHHANIKAKLSLMTSSTLATIVSTSSSSSPSSLLAADLAEASDESRPVHGECNNQPGGLTTRSIGTSHTGKPSGDQPEVLPESSPSRRSLCSILPEVSERLRNLKEFLGVNIKSDNNESSCERQGDYASQVYNSSLAGANYCTQGLSSSARPSGSNCARASASTNKTVEMAPNYKKNLLEHDRRQRDDVTSRKCIHQKDQQAKPRLSDHVVCPFSGKFHTNTAASNCNDRDSEQLDGRRIACATAAGRRRSSRRLARLSRRCSDETVRNASQRQQTIRANYRSIALASTVAESPANASWKARDELGPVADPANEAPARRGGRADELGHVEGRAFGMANGLGERQSETLGARNRDKIFVASMPELAGGQSANNAARPHHGGGSPNAGRRAPMSPVMDVQDLCPACGRNKRQGRLLRGASASSYITANKRKRQHANYKHVCRNHRHHHHCSQSARSKSNSQESTELREDNHYSCEPGDCRGPSARSGSSLGSSERACGRPLTVCSRRRGCGQSTESLMEVALAGDLHRLGSLCGAEPLSGHSLDQRHARSSSASMKTSARLERSQNYSADGSVRPETQFVNATKAAGQTETSSGHRHANYSHNDSQPLSPDQLYHNAHPGTDLDVPIKEAISSEPSPELVGCDVAGGDRSGQKSEETGSRSVAIGEAKQQGEREPKGKGSYMAAAAASNTTTGSRPNGPVNARGEQLKIVAVPPIQSSAIESASYDYNQTGPDPMRPSSSCVVADGAIRPLGEGVSLIVNGMEADRFPRPRPIEAGCQLDVTGHLMGLNPDGSGGGTQSAAALMNLPIPEANSESQLGSNNRTSANQGVDSRDDGAKGQASLLSRPARSLVASRPDAVSLGNMNIEPGHHELNHWTSASSGNSYQFQAEQQHTRPLVESTALVSGVPDGSSCDDHHKPCGTKRDESTMSRATTTGANYAIAITTTTSDGVTNNNQSALVAMASRMRPPGVHSLRRKFRFKAAPACDHGNRSIELVPAGDKRGRKAAKVANSHQMSRLQVRSASSLRSISANSLVSQNGTLNHGYCSSTSSYQHHHNPTNSNARFYKLIESRKKAAKMLIVIVIMFGLCYLPIHFLNILRCTIQLPQNDLTTTASLISHWLCYFNSAVNPLIYNFMSGKFRHEFANLFFCRFLKRKAGA